MSTVPVRTSLTIHQCSKIDWTKTALQGGFVWCDFENGKVFDLEEELVPAGKRACGANVTSSSVNLPAIPIVFREGVSRASLESVQ